MSSQLDLSVPEFVPASQSQFAESYPQFAKTLEGEGAELWRLLNQRDAFTHMVSVTLVADGPAVAGVTKLVGPILRAVHEENPAEADLLRKTVGAMVSFIMTRNGFAKTNIKRGVPPVRLDGAEPERIFTKGEVYTRRTS